jgi:hypothetical protein
MYHVVIHQSAGSITNSTTPHLQQDVCSLLRVQAADERDQGNLGVDWEGQLLLQKQLIELKKYEIGRNLPAVCQSRFLGPIDDDGGVDPAVSASNSSCKSKSSAGADSNWDRDGWVSGGA